MLSTHQLSLNFLVLQHVWVNLYCQLFGPTFFVRAKENTVTTLTKSIIYFVVLLLLVTQIRAISFLMSVWEVWDRGDKCRPPTELTLNFLVL